MCYNQDTPFQYTEIEMRARVITLLPHLLANRARYGRYLDVLVTHSPPFGIHDGQDLPHVGFKVFLTLMKIARPAYLLHGHTHIYRPGVTTTDYGRTRVTNVYPSRLFEWDDAR
jgi:Icc-related predicted phosphoesterase